MANALKYRPYRPNKNYYYQFYSGKAFYDDDEYNDRYEKMGKELQYGINYINRVGIGVANALGELDYGFAERLLKKAEQSFEKEKVLYDALNLSLKQVKFEPKLQTIQSTLENLEILGKQVTNHFNPPNSEKIAFLNKLNSKEFLDSLTMEKQTYLSFTEYGESLMHRGNEAQQRVYGKKKLTKAVNKALNRTGNKRDNYSEILKLIGEDFFNMVPEILNSEQIQEEIIKLIDETLQATLPLALYSLKSSDRLNTMLDYDQKKERETIKNFYKQLYKKIEKLFKLKVEKTERRYLKGALLLTQDIIQTDYGIEITQSIYEGIENNTQEGRIRDNLKFEELAQSFINLLKKKMEGTIKDNVDSKALNYLNHNKARIKEIILQAYSKNKTNESKLREFAQFSKSGVSGLLGEIASAISLSEEGATEVIITGSKKNNLGQKVIIDTQLIVYDKDKKKTALGIQVKNYTSKNNISLYTEEKISLTDKSLQRYMSLNDIKVLRFLVANFSLIEKEFDFNLSKEDLELFLHAFISSFLRIEDLSDDTQLTNNFYYLNNRIYPTSQLLLTITLKALEILKDAKKERLVTLLASSFPDIEFVEEDYKIDKNDDFMVVPYQPWAILRGRSAPPRGIPTGDENGFLPRRVDSNNVLSQMDHIDIRFKGLRVNISK